MQRPKSRADPSCKRQLRDVALFTVLKQKLLGKMSLQLHLILVWGQWEMTGIIIRSLQDARMSCNDKRGRINCGSISTRLRKKILLKKPVSYHARGKSPGSQREDAQILAMFYRRLRPQILMSEHTCMGLDKMTVVRILYGFIWMFLLDGSTQKYEKLCDPCGEAVLLIGMATQAMGWFSQKTETTHSSMIMSYYRMKGALKDFDMAMLNIL